MKKILIGLLCILIAGAAVFAVIFFMNNKPETEKVSSDNLQSSSDNSTEKNDAGEISYKQIDYNHVVEDGIEGLYYIDNRILLTAAEGTSKSDIENLIKRYNAEIVGCIEITDDYQIEFDKAYTKEELQKMADELKSSELVSDCYIDEASEPQFDMKPDDPEWVNEDWTKKNGNDINWGVEAIDAMGAWDYYKEMKTVNVGIIDSMFDTKHEDIKFAKVWNNPVDISKEKVPTNQSHGTHVSGTMAAAFGNQKGIAGVAPKTNIFAYSILGEQTDEQIKYTNHVADFYEWKYALSNLIINDCKVINVSMSDFDDDVKQQAEVYGDFLNKLIKQRYEFVIVQSAGNYGDKNIPSKLAENNGLFTGIDIKEVKDRIIVVGSAGNDLNSTTIFNSDGYNFWSSSSFGDRVDVLAPGVKIYSTVPFNKYENSYKVNNKTYPWSGTSMAAPHVSGIAAMCFSINEDLTGKQVKDIIKSTADNTPIYRTVNGKEDKSTAYYMVDAKRAVEEVEKNGVVMGNIFPEYKNKDREGVKITAYHVDENEESGLPLEDWVTYSDKEGNFELILPPGKYRLIVTYDGYDPYGITVDIKEHKTTILDDIRLLASIETFTINGIIKDEDGNLIDGATIKLDSDINSKSKETQSKNGKYSIDLTQRTFSNIWFSVEKENYKPFTTVISLENRDTKLNVKLEKEKPKTYIAAYLEEVKKIINEYGAGKVGNDEVINKYKISGLSYAKLIDFDNDGSEELMCIYGTDKKYDISKTIKIFGFDGKESVTLYEGIVTVYGSEPASHLHYYTENGKTIILTKKNTMTYIIEEWSELKNGKFEVIKTFSDNPKDSELNNSMFVYRINDHVVSEEEFSAQRELLTNKWKDIQFNLAELSELNDIIAETDETLRILGYSQKTESSSWKQLYNQMLDNEFKDYSNATTFFRLYDVNHDQIPELFVRRQEGFYKFFEDQYTIINEKVVKIEHGDYNGLCMINPKSEWILMSRYSSGNFLVFYKIGSDKIINSPMFKPGNDWKDSYIDGVTVNNDEFNNKLAEYDYGSRASIDTSDSPWVSVFESKAEAVNHYISNLSETFYLDNFKEKINAWKQIG